MPPKDYYKLLQVHPEADQESIEAAHQRLATKFDLTAAPDDPAIAAARQEIDEAFAVLGDPGQRTAYDASLVAVPVVESVDEAVEDAAEDSLEDSAPLPLPATLSAPPPARRLPSYAWVAAVAVAALAIIALVFVLRNRRPDTDQAAATAAVSTQTAAGDVATPAPAASAPTATRAPFPTTDASGPYILPPTIPNFVAADRPTRSQGEATAPVVMYEWSDYT